MGVAAAGEALGPEGARLSAAERTEVALDLRELTITAACYLLAHPVLALVFRWFASGRRSGDIGALLDGNCQGGDNAWSRFRYSRTGTPYRIGRPGAWFKKGSLDRCRGTIS